MPLNKETRNNQQNTPVTLRKKTYLKILPRLKV